MTLTTYPGVSSPQRMVTIAGAGAMRVAGTAASLVTTGASTGFPFNSLIIGDLLIALVTVKTTSVTVSSIATAGTSGLTWARLGFVNVSTTLRLEIWATSKSLVQQVSPGDTTLTLSGSAAAAMTVMHMRGISSLSVVNTSGTNSTTMTASAPTTTAANAFAILYNDVAGASTIVSGTSSPPLNSGFAQSGAGLLSFGTVDGLGITPSQSTTLNVTDVWGGLGIVAYGATVTLDDLNYLLREDGILLNNFSGVPIWDVETITGLSDSNVYNSTDQVDGANGAYVNAKFYQGKTIVIEGTCYTNPPVAESILDDMKYACRPVGNNNPDGVPFFYKHPNVGLRTISVKPLSFKSDITSVRTSGKVPYQIQMASSDAVGYSGRVGAWTDSILAGTTNSFSLAPAVAGNIETSVVLYFYVDTSDTGTIGQQITIKLTVQAYNSFAPPPTITITTKLSAATADRLPFGMYVLDIGAKALYRFLADDSLVDCSRFITGRGFFNLQPKLTNPLIFTRPSTTYHSGFGYAYADAWS